MSNAATTAEAAPEQAPSKPGRPKMRFKYKLALFLSSFLLMGLLRTGFLIIIVALLPSIIAYYYDMTRQRYLFRSVFLSNLTGLMPYLGRMLRYGPSSGALHQVMSDPSAWLIIYGAAMMGWLLVQICPLLAQMMISGYHQSQLARYERLQKRIEEEWGPEVTQFSQPE